MSDLLWFTLAATGVVLVLLVPGTYLISLFWERDPSHVDEHSRVDRVSVGDRGPLHVFWYRESNPSVVVITSTHGVLLKGTVGLTQQPANIIHQMPATTSGGLEPLAVS
jgi:hypothetical protein